MVSVTHWKNECNMNVMILPAVVLCLGTASHNEDTHTHTRTYIYIYISFSSSNHAKNTGKQILLTVFPFYYMDKPDLELAVILKGEKNFPTNSKSILLEMQNMILLIDRVVDFNGMSTCLVLF